MRTPPWGRMLLLVAVAAACFWHLGSSPLNETDEGFAANRAGSLFRHHTFMLTYDDVNSDEPQFHKPPLWYWIVAAFYKTIGYNEWAVRLPTAIASFLLILLVYRASRDAFGDVVASAGAALLCAVPFVLLHIRTAMLEMPVLLLSLAAMLTFARDERRVRAAIVAGLLCGALFLIKGPPGLVALGLVIAYGLASRPFDRVLARDVALATCAAALLPALYFMALPTGYRGEAYRAYFVSEIAGRMAEHVYSKRLAYTAGGILDNLRWMAVAAVGGFAICCRRLSSRAMRAWLMLALFVCVPIYFIASMEVMPFPRYLLPIYPFAAMMVVLFAFETTASAPASWLLVPFSVASFALEPSPLRWIPMVGGLLIFALLRAPPVRSVAWAPRLLAAALLGCIVVPTLQSHEVERMIAHELRHNQVDIVPLAREVNRLLPPDEKVIVGANLKCHALLFYGRRAVTEARIWLASDFVPGAERLGIFTSRDLDGVPHVDVETIKASGDIRLDRVRLASDAGGVSSILIAGRDRRLKDRAESLRLMRVPHTPSEHAIVVHPFEEFREREGEPVATTPSPLFVGEGKSVDLTLNQRDTVSSVELMAADKRQSLDHVRIEALKPGVSEWLELVEVHNEPYTQLTTRDGRVVASTNRALRLRFEPLQASQLRITKLRGPSLELSSVKLFVTAVEP